MELTRDEEKAIASLERLAKRWPKSLWLYSASGSLNVMRLNEDESTGHSPHSGPDPSRSITTINIRNDGGDW